MRILDGEKQNRFGYLGLGLAGILFLQVASLLILWPLSSVWAQPPPLLTTLYWIVNYPLATLLSHPLIYVLFLFIVSGLLLTGLFREKGHGRLRIVLVAALMIVVLYALAPWYQLPLQAAPGYRLEAPTAPALWERGRRFNQLMAEQTPCTYELQGWDETERLYYVADCQGQASQWRYEPNQHRIEQVDGVPAALYVEPGLRDDLLNRLRASGVRPAWHEPYTRNVLLRDSGLVSGDGRYTAVIIQHLYSVQDVAVLAKR